MEPLNTNEQMDYSLTSQNWNTKSGSEKGTQIDLKDGNITSYKFKLQAGTGDNKIIINSGAATYPLEIGKKDNFNVTWNGTLTCNGANIVRDGTGGNNYLWIKIIDRAGKEKITRSNDFNVGYRKY